VLALVLATGKRPSEEVRERPFPSPVKDAKRHPKQLWLM
jgi:hypothetical protein